MLKNKTFCILPFVHTTVQTNGDYTLCCRARSIDGQNIKSTSIDQWWTSDTLNNVRDKMLAGEEVDACRLCYKVEERNITSLRQLKNKEYKILNTDQAEKIMNYLRYSSLDNPVDLEIHMTNLCNLKCLMCNEVESSTILVENKQLGIAKHNTQDFVWNQFAIDQIKEIFLSPTKRHVDFRGGEPFMVPDLKEILGLAVAHGTAKNISLTLTTNCTKFSANWVELLNQFENVRFMCSVDATSRLIEYIRYGSNWEVIQENIKMMATITNVNMLVNITVQNLNVLGLPDLIKWCNEQQLEINIEALIYPEYFQVNNLPDAVKELAISELTKLNLKNKKILEIIEYLNTSAQPHHWEQFVATINLRDSARNNSITTVIPQLKEYWHAKTN